MKIAIVHYWWMTNRGGEAVIAELIKLFPHADLYFHVCDEILVRKTLGPEFKGRIFFTFISRLPFSKTLYQKYLPLMPIALEQLNLEEYDLIISSESGPAKGVITRPNSTHVCYCHSPMRYLWDMYCTYLNKSGFIVSIIFPIIAHWLRVWDRASADRVDFFISNSNYVAQRIKKYYRRDSIVIYPPVDVRKYDWRIERGEFYLYLGQLVQYKRPDLAVDAFNLLDIPLVIIGEGELSEELKKNANSNIVFLGRKSDETVKFYLERCKALIFPGIEDFGIVPVEAMAAGAPVIAFNQGGVKDTVINSKTGILFNEQTVESIINAVKTIQNKTIVFDSYAMHLHALKFDKKNFSESFSSLISKKIDHPDS